jgi:hypothetical protein
MERVRGASAYVGECRWTQILSRLTTRVCAVGGPDPQLLDDTGRFASVSSLPSPTSWLYSILLSTPLLISLCCT